MRTKLKLSNDKYPQCNFCLNKIGVFRLTGARTLVISICANCLESINEQKIILCPVCNNKEVLKGFNYSACSEKCYDEL